MNDMQNITADTRKVYWNYSVPQTNGKMLLLTVGNICVTGTWQGKLGEFYKAWAPMLRRNKELERKLGLDVVTPPHMLKPRS